MKKTDSTRYIIEQFDWKTIINTTLLSLSWSDKELADRLHVTHQAITQYRLGENLPKNETAFLLLYLYSKAMEGKESPAFISADGLTPRQRKSVNSIVDCLRASNKALLEAEKGKDALRKDVLYFHLGDE